MIKIYKIHNSNGDTFKSALKNKRKKNINRNRKL